LGKVHVEMSRKGSLLDRLGYGVCRDVQKREFTGQVGASGEWRCLEKGVYWTSWGVVRVEMSRKVSLLDKLGQGACRDVQKREFTGQVGARGEWRCPEKHVYWTGLDGVELKLSEISSHLDNLIRKAAQDVRMRAGFGQLREETSPRCPSEGRVRTTWRGNQHKMSEWA
jgi:hypothetical protein